MRSQGALYREAVSVPRQSRAPEAEGSVYHEVGGMQEWLKEKSHNPSPFLLDKDFKSEREVGLSKSRLLNYTC